jgi:hypothetical protein
LKSPQKVYLNYTSLNPVQIKFKTFGFKLKTLNQIRKLFLQAFIFNIRFWPSPSTHHPAHPAFGPTSRPRPSPPSSHPLPPITHSTAARSAPPPMPSAATPSPPRGHPVLPPPQNGRLTASSPLLLWKLVLDAPSPKTAKALKHHYCR